MKRFRVRAVDLNSKRPINYDAFEGTDADDVAARLNRAGMVAESIDEVQATAPIPSVSPTVHTHKIIISHVTSKAQWQLAIAIVKAWFLIAAICVALYFLLMVIFVGGMSRIMR